jgi:hypothetical protein
MSSNPNTITKADRRTMESVFFFSVEDAFHAGVSLEFPRNKLVL